MKGVGVTFHTSQGDVQAISNVDFEVYMDETVAIMGESGCGKSVLGHAAMRLLDDVAKVSGSVKYRGNDLYSMDDRSIRGLRGKTIGLIPQSPSTSFNPVLKIGHQIRELIEKAGVGSGNRAKDRAIEYLGKVGFSDPFLIYDSYPHRLSGGMCQRALIAMTLSVEPELVIADEPTKGLDALSRKSMLELLHKMASGSSMIMITHDFKAAMTCKKLSIMYSGEIVESGLASELLADPRHPYTKGLIMSQPAMGMLPIKGRHDATSHNYRGCRFRGRCDASTGICCEHPLLRGPGDGRKVRCHHA